MQRLSGTDSLFLAGETPAWHQHVAGLSIIDPDRRRPASASTRSCAASPNGCPLIPKLTWRLREVPLGLHRAGVDRGSRLRRPPPRPAHRRPGAGRPAETAAVVGQILSTQLDRRYPLWEIWYLDGLVNGRVGFLMKYHHCLLDGVAGSGWRRCSSTSSRRRRREQIPPLPDARARAERRVLLLQSARAERDGAVARRAVRRPARAPGLDAVGYALSKRPKPDVSAMVQAPRTSFNRSIGPRRAMAFTSVALDDVKALRQHYDVKLNDIALALCSGALRVYLDDRGELPDADAHRGRARLDARRRRHRRSTIRSPTWSCPLATDVDDPTERLRAISRDTRAAKEMHAALRAHPIGSIGQTAPPWVLAAAMRLAYESHLLSYVPGMMNTIVSNVPGPTFPLYLAGARLTGIFSASVILEGMGVNITVFSFDDRVDFGIHVDPDLVPEPWDLAAARLRRAGRVDGRGRARSNRRRSRTPSGWTRCRRRRHAP